MCEDSQDVKAESLKATNNPTGFQPLCTVVYFEKRGGYEISVKLSKFLIVCLWASCAHLGGIDMCDDSQDVKSKSLKATTNPTGFQSLCTDADLE